MTTETCSVCDVECNADRRVVHGCGQPNRQWCGHLGWHMRIALGRDATAPLGHNDKEWGGA